MGVTRRPGVPPILHKVDLDNEEALERFIRQPLVQLGHGGADALRRGHSYLEFRPAYNEVLFFENYPNIKNGMRSKRVHLHRSCCRNVCRQSYTPTTAKRHRRLLGEAECGWSGPHFTCSRPSALLTRVGIHIIYLI